MRGGVMRPIAISIVVFAGAVMAAAGTLAEAMPDAKRYNIVDGFGIGVVVVGGLLLVAELFNWYPFGAISSRYGDES
jgi:hypothetical protein